MKTKFIPVLALLHFSCSSLSRSPSSLPPEEMPTTDRDVAFEATLKNLDLNGPAYKLKYKDSGTSLGLKIKVKETKEKVGKWLPKNEAANPEAQVVSYYLGRFLGMGEMVIPAGYHTIQGRALSEFREMLLTANEKLRLRIKNKTTLQAALEKNPNSMEGVFTPNGAESFDLPDLLDTRANHGLGTLRQNHPIAPLIRADGPMPSTTRQMQLRKSRRAANTEAVLARELSKIMVLDILCGQFDRFSGLNLEGTMDSAGKLHFIARDNGGAGMGPGYGGAERYFAIVSRFDRSQIQQVRKIAKELAADAAATAQFFQIRSNPKIFAARVAILLHRVDQLVAQFGEAKVYFPD